MLVNNESFDNVCLTDFFSESKSISILKDNNNIKSSRILSLNMDLEQLDSKLTREQFEKAALNLGCIIEKIDHDLEPKPYNMNNYDQLEDIINSYKKDLIFINYNRDNSNSKLDSLHTKSKILDIGGENSNFYTYLSDLYAIYQQNNRLDNLNITFAGDLKYDIYLAPIVKHLSYYPNNKFTFLAKNGFDIPKDLIKHLKNNKVKSQELNNIQDLPIAENSILYHTRSHRSIIINNNEVNASFLDQENIDKLEQSGYRIIDPSPKVAEYSKNTTQSALELAKLIIVKTLDSSLFDINF